LPGAANPGTDEKYASQQIERIAVLCEGNPFAGFIRRIRAGDEEAAAELVRRFEPLIRREARMRLRNPRLSRLFDSADICQSVLASFFVRAALGEYDLEKPGHLIKLLAGMVCKKVAFQVRKHQAQRRDCRLLADTSPEDLETLAAGASPSRLVTGRELLDEVRQRLTAVERQLADLRAEGYQWAEIAQRLGGTPKARCKQLARAVRRVAHELGLDEDGDG
jgi:RNA polymerase sigma-70 factor (ECF subfamily)